MVRNSVETEWEHQSAKSSQIVAPNQQCVRQDSNKSLGIQASLKHISIKIRGNIRYCAKDQGKIRMRSSRKAKSPSCASPPPASHKPSIPFETKDKHNRKGESKPVMATPHEGLPASAPERTQKGLFHAIVANTLSHWHTFTDVFRIGNGHRLKMR